MTPSRGVPWPAALGAVVLAGAAAFFAGRASVGPLAPAPGSGPASEATKGPNVLIVLWDTVRADRLSPYDPTVRTTPNLGIWAKEAVVFEAAVAPAGWTVPSHGSMFTGLPPSAHGASADHLWLDGHHLTVAEWFADHGWDTYAFSANPNLSPRRVNLLQGFSAIDVAWVGRWRQIAVANAKGKLLAEDASTEISPRYAGPSPMEPQSMSWDAGPAAKAAFLEWLDRRHSDRPWFAYLSYMEAHKPRIPSLQGRRLAGDDATTALALATDVSFDQQLLYAHGQRDYTEAELRAIRAVYDATLFDLDRATTQLFTELQQRHALDDTIVVFTSDHGEALGEQHLLGHRYGLGQALLHVPLVIRWDGHLEPRRVSRPVSTLDLFDTLVHLAGLPPPDGARSGGDLLRDEPGAWGVVAEALDLDVAGYQRAQRVAGLTFPNRWERTLRAVIDGQLKLIADDRGERTLYDLAADPHEHDDLVGVRPGDAAALGARLEDALARVPTYDPSRASASDVPAADDARTREYLGVLGYVSDPE